MTEYNGWTNYETWCVNLWLTNDEETETYWADAAAGEFGVAEAAAPFTRLEVAKYALARRLKEELDAVPEAMAASLYGDLLQAALSEVNWDEIAGAFLSGVEATKEG